MRLDDAVEAVPGVGPRRAAALRAAGILTVEDLLLNLPLRYEDRSHPIPIARLRPGEPACVRARIRSLRRARGRRGSGRTEAAASDASGTVRLVWFHQPYLADRLQVGAEVLLWGRPVAYRAGIQLANPVVEAASTSDSIHLGRPVPIYRRIGEIGPALLRRLVAGALGQLEDVDEGLPERLLARHGLIERRLALRTVHYPEAAGDLAGWQQGRSPAHRRLAMHELVEHQTALLLQRRKAAAEPGFAHAVPQSVVADVLEALPFALTAAQRRCLDEVLADLGAPAAMHRLLQGDVGSGKTAVAGAALLAVARLGAQGALLAPTDLLARQHARTLGEWGRRVGIGVELVTAGVDARARRRVHAALAAGDPGVVVGTHALLQPRIAFAELGLVVIDEQHRFGVGQRAALRAKGRRQGRQPDLLVMTATPIPRSLALTLYGDLEVSRIDAMPPGRSPIRTAVRPPEEWPAVVAEIAGCCARGEQVYVVAPRIEEGDGGLRSATAVAEDLRARLPAVEIGLVHGDLPADERERVMESFVAGRTPILVATTVIEVGVDVPAATLMVVEHAERFGLAQLHQLRGRVGRGPRPGRCWLVPRTAPGATATARLATLCSTTDGFRIAEEDLRLRGPGEVLGTRQTGAFELRVGDPFAHPDWLVEAHRIARELADGADAEARSYRHDLRRSWRRRMRLARAG